MNHVLSRAKIGATSAVVLLSFLVSSVVNAATWGSVFAVAAPVPALNTLTLDRPSGTGNGDFLLAAITFNGAVCQEQEDDDSGEGCVTVTPPGEDWYFVNATNDETVSMATFYKIAGSSEPSTYTWTFSLASARSIGAILRYEDVDTASPIDVSAERDAAGSSSSQDLTAPSVTTTEDDEIVVVLFGDNSKDVIGTPADTDGITERFSVQRDSPATNGDVSSSGFDFVQGAAGATGDKVAHTTFGNRWVAQTIALRNCGEACDAPKKGGGSGSHAPTVQVVAPNGGETFLHGTQANIFWSATADQLQLVRVSLSVDGGATYPTLVTEQGMNMGFHDWTVPDVNTTEARIRVQAIGAGDVVLAQDASNENFTIEGTPVPPQPEVLGDTDTSLPDGVTAESFVKLASDGNPNTQEDSTVYWIGADNLAHAFVSQPSYMTWYASFEGVQVVDEATLAALTQGETIGVRPGTSWIKTVGDDKVYYVAPGNVLRWISSESVALMLAGENWNENVMDMDASLLSGYAYGEDLTVESLGTVWPNGLVRAGDNTWLIVSGERRRFATDEAFAANGFQERHVQADGSTGWTSLPEGTEIAGAEPALTDLMQ